MRPVFAPAFVFFHLVNDVLGDSQFLSRGQESLNLPARLKANGVLAREYLGNGETVIPASQRKLEGFICDDSLDFLMLRVGQVGLGENLEQSRLNIFQGWNGRPASHRLRIGAGAKN